jgi:hypothetical protein
MIVVEAGSTSGLGSKDCTRDGEFCVWLSRWASREVWDLESLP